MPRYVTRQSYDWWPEDNQPTTITVHEDERFIDTGLLDMHGNRLYRTDSVQMGFQPPPEKRKRRSRK